VVSALEDKRRVLLTMCWSEDKSQGCKELLAHDWIQGTQDAFVDYETCRGKWRSWYFGRTEFHDSEAEAMAALEQMARADGYYIEGDSK
jgi:hypothetical protein